MRRRTEEEEAAAWEVVTLQDKDRTPLVLKQVDELKRVDLMHFEGMYVARYL